MNKIIFQEHKNNIFRIKMNDLDFISIYNIPFIQKMPEKRTSSLWTVKMVQISFAFRIDAERERGKTKETTDVSANADGSKKQPMRKHSE